jgi:hypothetical protein
MAATQANIKSLIGQELAGAVSAQIITLMEGVLHS